MSSSVYGRKLNPHRRLREQLGVKGMHQTVVVTNNPSTINQNDPLQVCFPNLGAHDVIVPGTAKLAFTIALDSTVPNRTLVNNIGMAILQSVKINISGNEVQYIDGSDVFHCYLDLWKTSRERANAQYQGIDTISDRNAMKLRIGAGNALAVIPDMAIVETYSNWFHIPLDFELLETHMPFYQSALAGRLEYVLKFNTYDQVIQAAGDPNASYTIDNISLEFDTVRHEDLARLICTQYAGRMSILYDHILRHRIIPVKKSDSIWNIDLNVTLHSMRGILMLFEEPAAPYQRDTEVFYNPKITKVEVIVEGVLNQLFSLGMQPYQQWWDEARKFFTAGSKRHPSVGAVAKDLGLANVTLGEYLTSMYCLWLDFHTTDDNRLHGSGRRIDNTSAGIHLQITKKAEGGGPLNLHLFLISDAQLHIVDGSYKDKSM